MTIIFLWWKKFKWNSYPHLMPPYNIFCVHNGKVQYIFHMHNVNCGVCQADHLHVCSLSKITTCQCMPECVSLQELDTIIVVPGIANCSETTYVRTFTGYATNLGFRVAVLNHLGAKNELKLTAPRIFTYGMFLCIVLYLFYLLNFH